MEAPAVYDAVGNMVGPMLPWADDARFVARVGFTHGTQYYSLVLVRDKALGSGVNLWFLLDDCQGDAYLSVSHTGDRIMMLEAGLGGAAGTSG